MPDWKSLGPRLGLRFSLALLTLLVVAPIPLSVVVTVSAGSNTPDTRLSLPPAQPATCFSAAIATDALPKVKAFRSENEEEEGGDALHEARGSFLSDYSFRKVPERPLIAPRSMLSLYPLRC